LCIYLLCQQKVNNIRREPLGENTVGNGNRLNAADTIGAPISGDAAISSFKRFSCPSSSPQKLTEVKDEERAIIVSAAEPPLTLGQESSKDKKSTALCVEIDALPNETRAAPQSAHLGPVDFQQANAQATTNPNPTAVGKEGKEGKEDSSAGRTARAAIFLADSGDMLSHCAEPSSRHMSTDVTSLLTPTPPSSQPSPSRSTTPLAAAAAMPRRPIPDPGIDTDANLAVTSALCFSGYQRSDQRSDTGTGTGTGTGTDAIGYAGAEASRVKDSGMQNWLGKAQAHARALPVVPAAAAAAAAAAVGCTVLSGGTGAETGTLKGKWKEEEKEKEEEKVNANVKEPSQKQKQSQKQSQSRVTSKSDMDILSCLRPAKQDAISLGEAKLQTLRMNKLEIEARVGDLLLQVGLSHQSHPSLIQL
jgi:hypothetical protein